MPEQAAARPSSPYYTPKHDAFRETVRRFVAREIEPFATVEEGDRETSR
jgi:hypothetical protein